MFSRYQMRKECMCLYVSRQAIGELRLQVRSYDRPIDAGRIRARSSRQMASRTPPLSCSAACDWPRRLPRGGAARVGIGRRGRRVPRARAERRRFVVVVFTPRCLKPSSRVVVSRSGRVWSAVRACTFAVVSRRETKTKSSAASDGR